MKNANDKYKYMYLAKEIIGTKIWLYTHFTVYQTISNIVTAWSLQLPFLLKENAV